MQPTEPKHPATRAERRRRDRWVERLEVSLAVGLFAGAFVLGNGILNGGGGKNADAVGDRTAVDVGPGGARDVERRQRNADHRAPLLAPDDRRRTRRATEPGSIRAGVRLRAFDGGCPFQPRATVVGRPDDRAAFVAAADFGVADVRAVDVVGDVVAGHLVAGPRPRPPRAIRATASRASGRDPSLVTSAGPAARDA